MSQNENNSDAAAVPITRDLEKIIDACEIVAAELRFQAQRLDQVKLQPRDEEEGEFLHDLAVRYTKAASTVSKLQVYHQKRVQDNGLSEGIDASGKAAPFL